MSHRSAHRFCKDSEGAVLVAGIAMGLLMVGALWNIVSIGDAIIWRERAQDAADAAAFESAVWNARGMNVVVFLNIVMSAAMAILVVLRGTVILMSVLTAAAWAGCLTSWLPTVISQLLCTAAPWISNATRTVYQWENRANERVHRFIRGVKTSQKVVATVTPILGLKESIVRTSTEYRMPSIALSPALVPNIPGLGEQRIGIGVSLPVAWGGGSKLCEKAGEFVPHELFAITRAAFNRDVSSIEGVIQDIAGGLASNMASVFCGGSSPGDIAEINETFKRTAREACNGARDAGRVTEDDPRRNDPEYQDLRGFDQYWTRPRGSSTYQFDYDKCETDTVTEQNRRMGGSPGGSVPEPAEVWSYTANGDFFLQSWGLVQAPEPARMAGHDRGLVVPLGRAGNGEGLFEADIQRMGTAQAEMYFNCDGKWDACSGDAMWLMRWKARLRRVHNPIEMAGRAVSRELVEYVNGAITSAINGQIDALGAEGEARVMTELGRGDGVVSLASNFFRGTLYSFARQKLEEQLPFNPVGDPVSAGVDQTVGTWLARNPPPPETDIIH